VDYGFVTVAADRRAASNSDERVRIVLGNMFFCYRKKVKTTTGQGSGDLSA